MSIFLPGLVAGAIAQVAVECEMDRDGQEDLSIFAQRLKQAREERGWSLAKLGYAAEMSREQVAHYEYGRKEPRLKCLIRLAKALDCSTDFLCGLEN